MTRKNHKTIACALREARHRAAGDPLVYASKMNQWKAVVSFVAMALKKDNPGFDVDTFLSLAEYEDV